MTATPTVRARWSAELAPYEPVPLLGDDTIRLAGNETALGPFPAAREAIADSLNLVHRYPERDGRLIARLAEHHGLAQGMIALGNGADAIIGYVSAAFLRPGDEVVTGWPSFPTYVIDAVKQEATVTLAPLSDGAMDLDAIAERIGPRTRLVWICTPNNPTGGVVWPAAFRRFIHAVPDDVLVVVDEAYHEYAAGPDQLDTIDDYVRSRPNVAALRTFSKLYGLAGLRVGYLAGPPDVVTAIGQSRHYYDVTELGIVAALASLDSPEEVQRRRTLNEHGRTRLQDGLSALGLASYPSRANFVAVEIEGAPELAARLLARGLATRAVGASPSSPGSPGSLGSPELLRITVGSEAEIDRALELLAELLR